MKAIYKSIEGERSVLERYRAFLKRWPVPNHQVRVPTSQGETFVIISGLEDAPALLLLHGGVMNSAMWMGEVPAFARFFRVYCIDMIGEPGLSAPARPALASNAYAVWLDDVLSHFAVARAAILGISLGGWLALDFAKTVTGLSESDRAKMRDALRKEQEAIRLDEQQKYAGAERAAVESMRIFEELVGPQAVDVAGRR